MQKIFYIILLIFTVQNGFSQELFCDVSISAPDKSKIKTDPKVFKTLENAITEFMNTTKWTSETYSDNEKIECSIFIAITAVSGNSYSGSFTVVSKRPIFNSDYKTTIINLIDKDINFEYKEFEAIEYSENQFVTNLSHLLAYYANLIIAIDNETFAEKGGEVYLQKALELVNNVSASDATKYKGWSATGASVKNKRSRYWFVSNLLNPRYKLFRDALYKYHRLGLDNFYEDDKLARKNIKLALEELAKITKDDPNLSLMQMWSDAKSKEVINIYKSAPTEEKTPIINILRKVDPINAEMYNVISK